jgi:SAM-dependent methyltransferase
MVFDPPESDRIDLRQTFDGEALRYQRARPGYPQEVFDLIADAGELDRGSTVLEVGAGTGQATHSMAIRGWLVTAVELGASLADVGRSVLAEFDNVEFVTGDIEAIDLPTGRFDAVTAFTCFHWLNPATRAGFLASLVKPGGLLAVVDTHHIANYPDEPSAPFFVESQAIHDQWMPNKQTNFQLPTPDQIKPRLPLLTHDTLTPMVEHRVELDITYSAAKYVDVLETYSSHLALNPDTRRDLLGEIAACINNNYGGSIVKRYLYTLSLAKRSG